MTLPLLGGIMRLLPAAWAVLAVFTPATLWAQDTLRVLRYTPSDGPSPPNVITVTFDRPVAGMLERTIPAKSLVQIHPAVPGTTEWRDPITIRFLPVEPFVPGSRFDVTVDTSVQAIDGSRLVAPFRFSFRVPGPKLLARSFDNRYGPMTGMALNGAIRLLYSSAVDTALLRRAASMSLAPCVPGVGDKRLALRVVESRQIDSTDPYHFRSAGGWDRDTIADRFRRVVELVPESTPPLDCTVRITLPTTVDDSIHGRQETYEARTMPSFRIKPVDCLAINRCALERLPLEFTTPVRRADVERYVHLTGRQFELVGANDPSSSWQLKLRLTPHTRYEIRVDSALRDILGRPLHGSHRLVVATTDYRPAIAVTTGFLVVPRSGARTIPIRSVNVNTLRVLAYHAPESVRQRILATGGIDVALNGVLSRLRPDTTLVSIEGRTNVDTTISFPVPASAFGPSSPLLLLRMSIVEPRMTGAVSGIQLALTGASNGETLTILQASDLAVHTRLGADEAAIYVTGIADGRARSGVTVSQLDAAGNVVARAVTGNDGLAMLGAPAGLPRPRRNERPVSVPFPPTSNMIEAKLGDDRVALPLGSGIGFWMDNPLDPGKFGARPAYDARAAGAIFTDRAVYRPTEMLYLKAVVRRGMLGELTVPGARDSAHVLVKGPPVQGGDGVVLRDTVVRLSEFGTFVDSFPLGASLPLSGYSTSLDVIVGNQWRSIAQGYFSVAEYRPPEFLAEVTTDTMPHFPGDTIVAAVSARYLFGAPMSNARVQWRARMHDVGAWAHRIANAEGWLVGEQGWWGETVDRRPDRLMTGDTTLDASGRLTIRIPLTDLTRGRPGSVDFNVAVTDVTRQTVTASANAIVRGPDLYVLARTKESPWKAGKPMTVEIRAARLDGINVAGVRVAAELRRRQWGNEETVWGAQPRTTVVTVRTDTIVTRTTAVPYVVTPREAGYYDVLLSAPDGSGGSTRTSFTVYVAEERVAAVDRSRSRFELVLKPERANLKTGDVARVHFDSPFDSADVWLALEREGIIESNGRRERVIAAHRGDNVIEIPIEARHTPNLWVSAVLIARADPRVVPDSVTQRLRAGYVELHVAADQKALTVTLAPERAEYGPGDTATVRIRVRDARGRGARSEVALWAVDEGVLALRYYMTPDLVSSIYQPRGITGRLRSTLAMMLTTEVSLDPALARAMGLALSSVVVDEMSGSGVAGGAASAKFSARGPAALSPEVIRQRFRSTAFYLGRVVTNSNGDAVVRPRLPDNLTTFHVMAVAVDSADRFGHGDTTFVVTRPLVARSTLPRFVRPSDTLHAGAAVNVRDGKPRDVEVETSADGVAIIGESKTRLALPEGKGAEGRFTFAVPSRDVVRDTVVVRVGATDGTNADATETKLPVKPDFNVRTHAAIGAVRGSSDIVMKLPAGIDPARSRVSFRVGTSPLAPMLAAYERLRVYPYYCTEQISSVGRALVAVWRATRSKDTMALGGSPIARLQQLADEIAKRQRTDGAIKYWDDWAWSSPWLTAYAGLFLLDARDVGVAVDSVVLRRIGTFLHASLDTRPDTGGMNRFERRDNRLALGQRVAAVDFLRRAGDAAPSAEDQLLDVARAMTWEDRLRLAEVLSGRADRQAAAATMVDDAWRGVIVAGRRVDLPDTAVAVRDFPSRIAPAARLLTATLALRPDQPLMGGLIETVLQHGRAEGTWAWSTQDYASVVMALSRLTDTSRARSPVRLSGRTGVLLATADSSVKVPLSGLLENNELRLQISADQRAFYAVQVDEVPLAPPTRPDIQGIVVERWYERYADGTPITSIKEGELVRVRMRVTVPTNRQFVAVEDPLPAGLEPIDLRMRTSATLAPFTTTVRQEQQREGSIWQAWLYGSWDDGWWSPWEHKEIRDDRVVYFARMLWRGSYTATYVARATTSGSFVRPPAHGEEMYNPAVQGRSEGGRFVVGRER